MLGELDGNTKYIITYVDHGETCDGKARILDICDTKDEAIQVIREDIQEWADQRAGQNIEVDFDKMSAKHKEYDNGCEWQYHPVKFGFKIDIDPENKNNG